MGQSRGGAAVRQREGGHRTRMQRGRNRRDGHVGRLRQGCVISLVPREHTARQIGRNQRDGHVGELRQGCDTSLVRRAYTEAGRAQQGRLDRVASSLWFRGVAGSPRGVQGATKEMRCVGRSRQGCIISLVPRRGVLPPRWVPSPPITKSIETPHLARPPLV